MNLAPNVCVVPGVSAAVEENEECVGEIVNPVTGEESAVRHLEGEVDDKDIFVDIMSGITANGQAESEGWTFVDALARANLSVDTLAEGVVRDTSRLTKCESPYFISHWLLVCWNNMVATHFFHKLVISARLFMKKASWSCCVLVFDSSGEPAGHPRFSDSCAPGFSGTEFDVGRTSCEDDVGATVHAPMEYVSSINWSRFCIKLELGQFQLCSFSGPIEVPAVEFGEGDISTEAETSRQRISRSARISRLLVLLAPSASASTDFSGRDHSRTLLGQAFNDGMYHSR